MELVVNAFLIYSSPAIYRTTKKHHSFSKLRKKNHRYCVLFRKRMQDRFRADNKFVAVNLQRSVRSEEPTAGRSLY